MTRVLISQGSRYTDYNIICQLLETDRWYYLLYVSYLRQIGGIIYYMSATWDISVVLSIICCFSDKHAALRSNNKDWLARIKDNVSEWTDMSTRGQIIFSELALLNSTTVYKVYIISSNVILPPWYTVQSET
jgi:hypothetical protein